MLKIKQGTEAKALAALYNNARPQGLGFLHDTPGGMPESQAAILLKERKADPYFDYLKGRVMKVLIAEEIDPWLYDRDNGEGAAEDALRTAGVLDE